MTDFSRMPRYDIRNDGIGPYAIFYCDSCGREFRSQPDVGGAVAQDLGRQVAGGLLRKVPLFGNAVADNVVGEDPRYSMKLTPVQLENAWKKTQVNFRECPTCSRIVCLSDFDTQSGFCQEDSPRTNEIAEATGRTDRCGIKRIGERIWSRRCDEECAASCQNRPECCVAGCPLSERRDTGSARYEILPGVRHRHGAAGNRKMSEVRRGDPWR